MMTNLFSSFDPSSSMLSVSWLVFFIIPIMASTIPWKILNPTNILYAKLSSFIMKEMSYMLDKKEKSKTMVLGLFFMIMLMNVIAMYPQIFSLTSHLVITLPLALLFWLPPIIFGWFKETSKMLSHLVPYGTPPLLMMFMVIIELVSSIIRPITLCVRITANLLAGHLLMTLVGNAMLSCTIYCNMMIMMIPLMLSVLEMMVACIQAYVFMTLIVLYITELK